MKKNSGKAGGHNLMNQFSVEKMLQTDFPHTLTWMEGSRPGHLTRGEKFCADSDVQFAHTGVVKK